MLESCAARWAVKKTLPTLQTGVLNIPENGREFFHLKNKYNEFKKTQRIVDGKFVVF